ncbi:hypothetical protein M8818_007661 [Zalaria obscura]|uniref:Uncharacterized protein n=1 Tax=Zalaria obscura TaxID=2024903 RepID=A0ACC3S2K9_9PEZI
MKEEADALIDIYSYAASYLLIPELKTMMTNLVTDMKRRGPGKTSKKSKHYHVTISLPEQNIQVSALATSSRMAEVAAALKFKKHAEKLHANASAESTMKQTVLTVETAKPFIDYYRSKRSWPYLEVGFNEVSQKLLRYDRVSFVAILSLGGKAVGKLVRMHSKKDAEKMAYLTAAVELAKGQPELLDDFAKQLETGTSLAPVKPVELSLDPGAVSIMRQSLWTIRNAGLPDERQTPQAEELDEDFRPRRLRSDITKEEIEARNKQLRSRLDAFNTSDKVAVLREQKAALPMNGYRKPVLEMISRSIYSIVVGATGSGKTTQVPQILLDDAINRNEGSQCNIICTQPRRIAATSVAQRVAVERGEMFQDTVGYHVRFENRRPVNAGSILYCTTGILLEQLKRSPDEVLDHASHLVIDEVHERDLQIDFLMVVLKKAVRERLQAGKPVPKIVLMSATLDTELFAKYFGEQTDGEIIPCPSISVPGRTFPVKEFYLDDLLKQLPAGVNQAFGDSSKFLDAEKRFAGSHSVGSDSTSATESAIDWKRDRSRIPGKLATEAEEAEEALVPLELTAAIILHICKTSKDGAILAFLPGLAELSKVDRLLKDNLMWQRIFGTDLPKMDVHLLHSTVPPEEQANVFKPPGTNIRKVILSTNIAETSVTIPDVKFVVDSGKLREKRYDQAKRISRLQTVWVSRSNSKQRAGRAGRVQNGTYYALFTKERFQSLRAIVGDQAWRPSGDGPVAANNCQRGQS